MRSKTDNEIWKGGCRFRDEKSISINQVGGGVSPIFSGACHLSEF